MNWPNSDSSSSPTGFSSETRACAERLIDSTSSGSIPVTSAISSAVGSRPSSVTSLRSARPILLSFSTTCTGMRMGRALSASERGSDRLTDPPGGVGGELEPLAVVELLRRPDQPERALLDQVQERQPLVAV